MISLFCKHAEQLGLKALAGVTDFVQKQGAAGGYFKKACAGRSHL
jgi:hypothetical protein